MDVAEKVGSLHVGVAALLDVVEEAATLSPELSSLRDALTVAESHLAAAWDLACVLADRSPATGERYVCDYVDAVALAGAVSHV